MKSRQFFVVFLCMLVPWMMGSGCMGHSHADEGAVLPDTRGAVVPEAERSDALEKGLEGPTKTEGIASVKALAKVLLGADFEGMDGHQLRVRELVIAPGGVVAVHQHDQRPGVAYIIEGEMVEHRGGADEPIVHKAGSVAVEHSGVQHWWENRSQKPARALVIDIIPEG